MATSIIVTDLTRFKDEQKVCIAGTDLTTGKCIRPMPYLMTAVCKQLQILPGAILRGNFTPAPNLAGPHQEDCNYKELQFAGACTSGDFKRALNAGLFDSISEGFEIDLVSGQKSVPLGHQLGRSIITIRIDPAYIDLVEDEYNRGRIKVHLTDGSGRQFRYLPITDLGFYRYAMAHQEAGELGSINAFIHGQEDVYVRIGLGRNWDQRPGYWMQVNGIYTFPDYHSQIRSYT